MATFHLHNALITVALLSGCATQTPASGNTPSLANSQWQVSAVNNGRQAVSSVLNGSQLTLAFNAAGLASGLSGCNRFSAPYTEIARSLHFGAVAGTRKMCAEPIGLMAQESQMLTALSTVASWEMENGRLVLRTESGAMALVLERIDRPAAGAQPPRGPNIQPPIATSTVKGRGQEPAWHLEVDANQMRFGTIDPVVTMTTLKPSQQAIDGGIAYIALGQPRGDFRAEITAGLCSDSMTGMPYPWTLRVRYDRRDWRGCAGDPAATLFGTEWVVEDIDGGGVIDNSRATLNFAPDGRLFGRSSCNTYQGRYTITGEGITVSQLAGTMMACAPSLMQQEQRFNAALTQTQRFAFNAEGALLLFSADQRRILARR